MMLIVSNFMYETKFNETFVIQSLIISLNLKNDDYKRNSKKKVELI